MTNWAFVLVVNTLGGHDQSVQTIDKLQTESTKSWRNMLIYKVTLEKSFSKARLFIS
jgi:hypothetical protein